MLGVEALSENGTHPQMPFLNECVKKKKKQSIRKKCFIKVAIKRFQIIKACQLVV